MKAICSNLDCRHTYKITPAMIGRKARCGKCDTIFIIQQHLEEPEPLYLDLAKNEDENTLDKADSCHQKKRRSTNEVMDEKIEHIKNSINSISPILKASIDRQDNESDTRLILNQIIQDALGYSIDDIKTELRIDGRKADYVLSCGGKDMLVVEVKRVGVALRANQIFQATSYAAYSGMKWAVLTNAVVWQLYHVSTGEKVEANLVFTIDLRDGLDDTEALHFYLISKHGLSRKNLLDRLWGKISALCYDNIVNAILSDEVVSRIRMIVNRQTGTKVTDIDVIDTIENNIFRLE